MEEYAEAAERADSSASETRGSTRFGPLPTSALLASIPILAALTFVAGYLLAPNTGSARPMDSSQMPSSAGYYPDDSSAEAGFARDMQTHHAQAVEMALIVREKSTDPTLRALAYDIITSQQQQMGQIYAWLEQWGLPQDSRQPAMAWMSARATPPAGTSGSPAATPSTGSMGSMPGLSGSDPSGNGSMLLPDGRMPGMASPEQLARLRQLRGRPAETLFLRLMIAHHEAGIRMAASILQRTSRLEVVTLATAIQRSQTSEVNLMRQLLRSRR